MNKDEFLTELATILNVPPAELQMKSELAKFESWDSMAVVQFIALADEHFHVVLGPQQIEKCSTVEDLFALAAQGQSAGA